MPPLRPITEFYHKITTEQFIGIFFIRYIVPNYQEKRQEAQ